MVQQKRRTYAPDRRASIEAKVQKLIKVEFIRKTKYSTWLSNVVMVKKANGK